MSMELKYGITNILLIMYNKERLIPEISEFISQCNNDYLSRWPSERISKLSMYCGVEERKLLKDLSKIGDVYYANLDCMKDQLDSLNALNFDQMRLRSMIPKIVDETILCTFSNIDYLAYIDELERYITRF